MSVNKKYPEEDWWHSSQLELVNDRSLNWKLQKFKADTGFWIERNGQRILGKVSEHDILPVDAVIVENTWDHEHCELCSNKIMEGDGNINEGYCDGQQWICPECYKNFILPRL